MSGLDVAALRAVAEAADRAPLPSTERVLAWQAFEWECDPETVLTLLDRLEAAEAAVERVRALADRWDERLRPSMAVIAKAIRAALDQPAPTTPGGDA